MIIKHVKSIQVNHDGNKARRRERETERERFGERGRATQQ
jgi:hypothetical protein